MCPCRTLLFHEVALPYSLSLFCSSVILFPNGREELVLFGQGRQIWVLITVMGGCHKQRFFPIFGSLFSNSDWTYHLLQKDPYCTVAVMSDFKRVSFQLNCLVHSSFILMLKNYSVAPGSGKFDPDTQFLPGFCLPSAKDTKWGFFLFGKHKPFGLCHLLQASLPKHAPASE